MRKQDSQWNCETCDGTGYVAAWPYIQQIVGNFGEEKARMYLEANELALRKYRELAASIDCDFEERSSYIYSRTDREYIEREVRAASLLGMKAEFCETPELPFDTVGAVRFPNQAQMNPVKFLYGLVEDIEKSDKVTIFEEMPVDDWVNGTTWSGLHITIPKISFVQHIFHFIRKQAHIIISYIRIVPISWHLIMCRRFVECMQMRLIVGWHCEDIKT